MPPNQDDTFLFVNVMFSVALETSRSVNKIKIFYKRKCMAASGIVTNLHLRPKLLL